MNLWDEEEEGLDIAQHFQVNVIILEAKNLSMICSDCKVIVRIGDRKKRLHSRGLKTDSPYFNELCIFHFYQPLSMLLNEIMEIKLYGRPKLLMTRFIGAFKVEMSTVWFQPNHGFYHKWAALSNVKNPALGLRGYLKCDIGILAKGTKWKLMDTTPTDDIKTNLMIPFGDVMETQRAKFIFTVFRADNFSNYVARLPLNLYAYVRITYGGKVGKTSVAHNTFEPFWNEELSFDEVVPALCQYVHIELCDDMKPSGNAIIGAARLDLRLLSHVSKKGFLPTFGPTFLYLYRNFRRLEKRNSCPHKSCSFTYACRLLMALRTDIVNYAEDVLAKKKKIRSMKPENISALREGKYFRYREFIFFAAIFDVLLFDTRVSSTVTIRVNIGPGKPMIDEHSLRVTSRVRSLAERPPDDDFTETDQKTITFRDETESDSRKTSSHGESGDRKPIISKVKDTHRSAKSSPIQMKAGKPSRFKQAINKPIKWSMEKKWVRDWNERFHRKVTPQWRQMKKKKMYDWLARARQKQRSVTSSVHSAMSRTMRSVKQKARPSETAEVKTAEVKKPEESSVITEEEPRLPQETDEEKSEMQKYYVMNVTTGPNYLTHEDNVDLISEGEWRAGGDSSLRQARSRHRFSRITSRARRIKDRVTGTVIMTRRSIRRRNPFRRKRLRFQTDSDASAMEKRRITTGSQATMPPPGQNVQSTSTSDTTGSESDKTGDSPRKGGILKDANAPPRPVQSKQGSRSDMETPKMDKEKMRKLAEKKRKRKGPYAPGPSNKAKKIRPHSDSETQISEKDKAEKLDKRNAIPPQKRRQLRYDSETSESVMDKMKRWAEKAKNQIRPHTISSPSRQKYRSQSDSETSGSRIKRMRSFVVDRRRHRAEPGAQTPPVKQKPKSDSEVSPKNASPVNVKKTKKAQTLAAPQKQKPRSHTYSQTSGSDKDNMKPLPAKKSPMRVPPLRRRFRLSSGTETSGSVRLRMKRMARRARSHIRSSTTISPIRRRFHYHSEPETTGRRVSRSDELSKDDEEVRVKSTLSDWPTTWRWQDKQGSSETDSFGRRSPRKPRVRIKGQPKKGQKTKRASSPSKSPKGKSSPETARPKGSESDSGCTLRSSSDASLSRSSKSKTSNLSSTTDPKVTTKRSSASKGSRSGISGATTQCDTQRTGKSGVSTGRTSDSTYTNLKSVDTSAKSTYRRRKDPYKNLDYEREVYEKKAKRRRRMHNIGSQTDESFFESDMSTQSRKRKRGRKKSRSQSSVSNIGVLFREGNYETEPAKPKKKKERRKNPPPAMYDSSPYEGLEAKEVKTKRDLRRERKEEKRERKYEKKRRAPERQEEELIRHIRMYNGCNTTYPRHIRTKKHYGHSSVTGKYPCLHVNGEWPNALRMVYRSNVIQQSVMRLRQGIKDVEYELETEDKIGASDKMKKVFSEVSAECREILTLTESVEPEDTNLYREKRKIYREEIKEIIRNMEETSKKKVLLAEHELKRAYRYLATLKKFAQDPEDTFPDTEIWLIKNGRTIAQHRMQTRKLAYSPNEKERGVRSGKIQSVFVRGKHGEIVAKLEMFMWFGLGSEFLECRKMLPGGFLHDVHRCRGTSIPNIPLLLKYKEAHYFQCRVHLFQARITVGADDNGLADPFVRAIILDQQKDSKVKKKTLNPIWDETLVFPKIKIYGPAEYIKLNSVTITIEVFDRDSPTQYELIGRVLLKPIVRLFSEKRIPPKLKWQGLRRKCSETGKILLASELFEVNKDEPKFKLARRKAVSVPNEIRPKTVGYRLEVLFWGVRELRRKVTDATRVYVTLECAGKKLTSPTVKNPLRMPNFPGKVQTLDLQLPEELDYMPSLLLKLYQVDLCAFESDAYSGNCIIPSVKLFFCETVDNEELKRKELTFLELMRETERALEEEEREQHKAENKRKKKLFFKKIYRKVWYVAETAAAVPVKYYKKLRCKVGKKCSESKGAPLPEILEDEVLDWWVKYYASKENELRKLELDKRLAIYGDELEAQPQFHGFNDFIYTFNMVVGKVKNEVERSINTGKVKAAIKLYRWPSERHHSQTLFGVNISKGVLNQLPRNDAIKYITRVYIVSCKNLTPKDAYGKADPYLIVKLGRHRVKDKKNYVPKQLNPIFGKCFEFRGIFPRQYLLKVKVMDRDVCGRDELIGETTVDLENRYYTKHHASCGISQVYHTSGYTAWRDALKPTEILKLVSKQSNMPDPIYSEWHVRVGEYEFRPDVHTRKDHNEHLALAALKKWHQVPLRGFHVVPEHVESRPLYHPKYPGVEQGKVEMWVDIFPADYRFVSPIVDIRPRKPVDMELRAIIWNVENVILDDKSFLFNEKMSDIYVQGWMNALEQDKQSTDVHYRSLNGEGNFNWRFVFRFKYIHSERRLVVYQKMTAVDTEPEEKKYPCKLELQVWDNDFLSDDFLGSLSLELGSMPRGAKISTRCKLSMLEDATPRIDLFKIRRTRGWWPFRRLVDAESSKYNLTGKVDLELEVVSEAEAKDEPVGKGRAEPKPLPPPKRPETSFIWALNPIKTFRYIICRKYGKYMIIVLIIAMLVAFILLGIYAFPGYVVKRIVGA